MGGVEEWLGSITEQIRGTLASMILPAADDVIAGIPCEEWSYKVV